MGTPGVPWGEPEKKEWLAAQKVRREYSGEVLGTIERLRQGFDVEQYGALSIDSDRYPLYAVKSKHWQPDRPNVLVTGGIHGYETSGVQGALRFLETEALSYADRFNLLVAPCVSPWGYETINRWNPAAIDPNRSFREHSPSEEVAALMSYVHLQSADFVAHMDLHETTDTDNSEFRPALAARDGIEHTNWHIPDGFYLVGDAERPTTAFHAAVIEAVEQVTHIAPPAKDGRIIGETVQQWGVIYYPAREAGLCMGLTRAEYVGTTEVYPDSPKTNPENCIEAQVKSVTGALAFLDQA
ncbi:MAG: M14 family metallocarboxypeptidase [Pseudomonadota bacterium]